MSNITEFNNVGAIGFIKDTPPEKLPGNAEIFAWSDVNNVRMVNGDVEKSLGYSTIFTPSVAPWFINYVKSGQNNYYVYFSNAKAYVYDGTTNYNITRQTAGVDVDYTADSDYMWDATSLNNIPVYNNRN